MAENASVEDVEVAVSEASSTAATTTPKIINVPWFCQLKVALQKNRLLLIRRPVQVALMCLCSVGSVLLAFSSISNKEFDFSTIPLTPCGAVDPSYLNELEREQGYDAVYNTPNSYNMHWARGLPVTLMGTMRNFTIVQFVFVAHECFSLLRYIESLLRSIWTHVSCYFGLYYHTGRYSDTNAWNITRGWYAGERFLDVMVDPFYCHFLVERRGRSHHGKELIVRARI